MKKTPDIQTYQTHVFYAGESQRRVQCLQLIPSVTKVAIVGGGEEPDIREVVTIAGQKIDYARQRLNGAMRSENGIKKVLVAADARTEISALDGGGKVTYVSKGKPQEEKDVLANFRTMNQVANIWGYAPYKVVSASVFEERGVRKTELMQAGVVISSESLQYLSSNAGFTSYLREFKEFYSSAPYSTNGLKAIDVQQLSGGISLPVLASMGLVESVDGVRLKDGEKGTMIEALKGGLLTVACGFGATILEMIHPEALDKILAWNWLNEVTEKVLTRANHDQSRLI